MGTSRIHGMACRVMQRLYGLFKQNRIRECSRVGATYNELKSHEKTAFVIFILFLLSVSKALIDAFLYNSFF